MLRTFLGGTSKKTFCSLAKIIYFCFGRRGIKKSSLFTEVSSISGSVSVALPSFQMLSRTFE